MQIILRRRSDCIQRWLWAFEFLRRLVRKLDHIAGGVSFVCVFDMGRQPCCDKLGVKKGPWTAEEDKKLINFILTNGQCCWRAVPKLAGLRRCGKSCRLRWTNYLRPDLKRGLLTEAEEQLVIDLHARLGNRLIISQ